MLISRNWLKKYVKLADTATAEEIASKLTLSTVEVEGYKNTAEHFDEIVVGKILAIEKHPQADKLQVCLVDVGTEKLSIVCGGSNLVKNMLVAVAKVGAFVAWHGEGDLVKLKPVEIRGVASAGMICGADEIGLATFFPKKQEKEILDISFLKVKPGTPVAKALELQDIIFEIDNKSLSNRPDLWSHYGLAREVAVLYNREVAPYQTKPIKEGKEMPLKVKIEEYKLCSRYMAVALSGIVVEESPLWLKRSLSSVGIRPINTIVDITNYVMTDIGQPMHAFDARYFPTQQIIIRKALEGEKLTTLDGHERVVSPEMLVIANEEKPLAVAGIMGGSESGITTLTDTIVFESANFDATSIRKTSSVLGLRSDSSVRFEKSLDPELCQVALQKAVELVLQICPNARVVSKVIDSYPRAPAPRTVQFPVAFIAQKLGIEIPLRTIVTILKRLGFEVKEKNSLLTIDIPSWRATKDITTPEDVVEEILRIYGYHQVPSQLPLGTIAPPEVNGLRMIETNLREVATKECAYTEVYNYSFVSEHQIKALGDACENYIELDNPLSKEKPFLRRNLLISLLENVQHNQEMYDELAVYEIGKTYLPEEAGPRVDPKSDELLPRQDTWFTAVYRHKKDSTPFWKVRRILERIFENQKISFVLKQQHTQPWQHPVRSAEIQIDEKSIGSLYELHPLVGDRLGINERVGVLEIDLARLEEFSTLSFKVNALPTFPEVTRDFAFLVPTTVHHQEIISLLSSLNPLIKKVELFDVYSGDKVPKDTKSMAYRITLWNNERTLAATEIEEVEKQIVTALKDTVKAQLRV